MEVAMVEAVKTQDENLLHRPVTNMIMHCCHYSDLLSCQSETD